MSKKRRDDLYRQVIDGEEYRQLSKNLSESDRATIESIVRQFIDPFSEALDEFEKVVEDPEKSREFEEAVREKGTEKTRADS